MTSVLDLKNPKNRKIKNSHSVNDILKDEPDEHPEGFLDNLERVDTKEEIPDNPGVMEESMSFPATFTRAPLEVRRQEAAVDNFDIGPLAGSLAWTAPDKHPELISHALRKWIIVILAAMAFVALFWQGSILTGITFFALALVTSMHFWREAVHHQYEIHPHGIAVGGEFHHYHDLDSFWIHLRPDGFHELSLCTGRFLNHYIKVSLKDQDPFEIRGALMPYLSEKRHEQGLEDWLRRKLGL